MAQLFKFTAVLLKLQATQKPPKKLLETFANHCQINSLLGESLCLVVVATNLATAIVSVNHIRAIIIEKIAKFFICSKLIFSGYGITNSGNH